MSSLPAQLKAEVDALNAVGQVSTPTGDEVLCTTNDHESKIQAATLATTFIEIDNLSKSLKLGSIQQVIMSGSQSGDSVVQSKVSPTDAQKAAEGDALLVTTMAPSLQNAMIGDGVLTEVSARVLNK